MIHLTRASLEDLGTYQALEKSVPESATLFPPITNEDAVRRQIETTCVYLIKADRPVLGKIEFTMNGKDHACISGLVLHPSAQGLGIARRALAKVLDMLQQVKRVDLVAHPHNTKALTLYLSLGFVIEEWKEDYFGDGEPRLVLVKRQS